MVVRQYDIARKDIGTRETNTVIIKEERTLNVIDMLRKTVWNPACQQAAEIDPETIETNSIFSVNHTSGYCVSLSFDLFHGIDYCCKDIKLLQKNGGGVIFSQKLRRKVWTCCGVRPYPISTLQIVLIDGNQYGVMHAMIISFSAAC